jgi:hypothetical protein
MTGKDPLKRALIILGITLAAAILLAPGSSSATATNGYRGSTDAGGLIAIRAKFNGNGEPTSARSLRWANIPASCQGSPTAHSGELGISMPVDNDGKFHGSDKLSTGAKVTIRGRFKHHAEKASGTFRLKGTIPGCVNADTGTLGWDMNRK